jgi:hypothetical protein
VSGLLLTCVEANLGTSPGLQNLNRRCCSLYSPETPTPNHHLSGATAPCKAELAKFDAAAKGAQAVVQYGRLNAAGASEREQRLLKAMGVDLAKLGAAPCELQVVLLPHGAGKEEIDEYKT